MRTVLWRNALPIILFSASLTLGCGAPPKPAAPNDEVSVPMNDEDEASLAGDDEGTLAGDDEGTLEGESQDTGQPCSDIDAEPAVVPN